MQDRVECRKHFRHWWVFRLEYDRWTIRCGGLEAGEARAAGKHARLPGACPQHRRTCYLQSSAGGNLRIILRWFAAIRRIVNCGARCRRSDRHINRIEKLSAARVNHRSVHR